MATDQSTTYESLIEDSGLITSGAGAQKETLDPRIVKVLESKSSGTTKIIDATGYGASFWTRTIRVKVEHINDNESHEKAYFVKLASGPESAIMMEGEFRSQTLLYKYVSEFIPEPVAWGVCEDAKTYYFISDFVEMTDDIPSPDKVCGPLAELHLRSMSNHEAENPHDRFGLATKACQGNIVLNHRWYDTWEQCFKAGVEDMIESEQKTQGEWPEFEPYKKPFLEQVIKRLLRPLSEGENKIKPCLVHGDLWHGNTSVSVDNGNAYAFDSCAYWAHNEYELGIWRAGRYKFKRPYYHAYIKRVPISAPEDQWDDRNILYAVRIDMLCSALYATNKRFRELALEGIKFLVDKYGADFEDEALDSSIEYGSTRERIRAL